MKLVALLVVTLIACTKPPADATPGDKEGAEEPAPKKAKGSGLDLSAKGLPIVIDVPACAKVGTPMVKVPDNAHDLMVGCEPKSDDAVPFALQIGPSKGKLWKSDVQEDLNFKRWIKTESNFIHAEMTQFSQTVQHFAFKTKIGGVEYICFNQFDSGDEKLIAQMIAACRSMRAP